MNTKKECPYWFKSNKDTRYAFTDWMFDNNYSVDKKIDFHHIFTNGVSLNDEFDSIEEAYATFAFLVHGYCNQ